MLDGAAGWKRKTGLLVRRQRGAAQKLKPRARVAGTQIGDERCEEIGMRAQAGGGGFAHNATLILARVAKEIGEIAFAGRGFEVWRGFPDRIRRAPVHRAGEAGEIGFAEDEETPAEKSAAEQEAEPSANEPG